MISLCRGCFQLTLYTLHLHWRWIEHSLVAALSHRTQMDYRYLSIWKPDQLASFLQPNHGPQESHFLDEHPLAFQHSMEVGSISYSDFAKLNSASDFWKSLSSLLTFTVHLELCELGETIEVCLSHWSSLSCWWFHVRIDSLDPWPKTRAQWRIVMLYQKCFEVYQLKLSKATSAKVRKAPKKAHHWVQSL